MAGTIKDVLAVLETSGDPRTKLDRIAAICCSESAKADPAKAAKSEEAPKRGILRSKRVNKDD